MTTPGHAIRFVAQAAALVDLCWRSGRTEANGGILSQRRPTDEVEELFDHAYSDLVPCFDLPLPAVRPTLEGRSFPGTTATAPP